MKKQMISGVLGIAMLSMLVLPVHAEEQSGDTTIKATITSTYTLTIPQETPIDFNAETTNLASKLKVTGNVLPTQKVDVTATPGNFHNNVQNTDLPYTLKDDNGNFTGASWNADELRAGLEGEGKGKEIGLTINIAKSDWNQAKAGDYTGTITFTAQMAETN
ncbi:hypothetical protein [Thomasclavelia sp.]